MLGSQKGGADFFAADHFACRATACTRAALAAGRSTELMTRASVSRGLSSAVCMTRVSRATASAWFILAAIIFAIFDFAIFDLAGDDWPSRFLRIQQERSGYSARGAAGQRQTFSDGDGFQARDEDIVDGNLHVGGNAGRERNFHQIESVELARQRHRHMARRMRMAGQRDLYFAALECAGVLGELLEDFRGQVGALE
jgi:hypothetical protein